MAKVLYDYNTPGTRTVKFELPGLYKIECWGAKGGGRGTNNGGKGGYSRAIFQFSLSDIRLSMYAVVGGKGDGSSPGYNGGAKAGHSQYGGGATDFRIGNNSINNRIIVAGGGGSVGASGKAGGYGGGLSGESRTEPYGSGGTGGTQTGAGANSGKFGYGGAGNSLSGGYGGGGGGGWYGGGGVKPDGSGDDDRGGGGGSGYVLTSSSHKPPGYIYNSNHFAKEYSMSNSVNDGEGRIKITLVEPLASFSHFAFTSDGKEFYIPNEHFYTEEHDEFKAVDRTYLLEVDKNKSKLISDINKMFETFTPIGEPFYKRFKDKKLKLVKILMFSDKYESYDKISPKSNLSLSYNLTKDALKKIVIELKDEIECPKTVGNYFIQGGAMNQNIKFALFDNNLFYGNEFKIINYDDIEEKGFTFSLIRNKFVDLEKFKIVYKFTRTIYDFEKENNLKSTKVIKKIGGISRVLGEDEYDVIYDKEVKKSYIRFNNDYNEIILNKTFKEQYARVNTLDKF